MFLASILLFCFGFLSLTFGCRQDKYMDNLPPGYELTASVLQLCFAILLSLCIVTYTGILQVKARKVEIKAKVPL